MRRAVAFGLEAADQEALPLKAYKAYLDWAHRVTLRYHRWGGRGLRVARLRSQVFDVLNACLLGWARERCRREHGVDTLPVALLALGGYGRGELCPRSDIDVMFLYPSRNRPDNLQALQTTINDAVLYGLWDLDLKVGHSTRTAAEARKEAAESVESKNAMLEARFLGGDEKLFERFQKDYERFIRKENIQDYIEQRLVDQRERRERFGGTVFVQEPDIKNGVGGLRDYQNILWMARLKLDSRAVDHELVKRLLPKNEQQAFIGAYNFLLRVRHELHFQTDRPTDLLALDRQPQVAFNLGYRDPDLFRRIESFMRDYYRNAQLVFRTSEFLEQRLALDVRTRVSFKEVLQSRRHTKPLHFDGFMIHRGVISLEKKRSFEDDPLRLLRVFRHAQQRKARLDLELKRQIEAQRHLLTPHLSATPEAARCFRSILQEAGRVCPTLRQMHDTRLLAQFFPEWGSLECLVQHEYYHRYTADEHTLSTIEQLDHIFSGQELDMTRKYHEALKRTALPALLYLILLLHDIGKARGPKGHAERGAAMATGILERFRVLPEVRVKIQSLIELHLEMARFWQRFDIDDPEVIQAFAGRVGDAQTLHYLYVLTFCDSRGTNQELWNSYKDTLHTQLYQATLQHFGETDMKVEATTLIPKETILERLPDLSKEEVEAHYNLLPERYFAYNNAEDIALHLAMIHRLLKTIAEADSLNALDPVIEWRDDLNLGLSVVHIVTWDRAGLFYKLAGAFSLADLSIVSSKALTRADHITIDTFYVSDPDGGVVRQAKARAQFREHLRDSLLHNKDLSESILNKAQAFARLHYLRQDQRLGAPLPPRVDVYHELALRRTIIEVQATDSIGLLYQIARTIFEHGFDIAFARIATERDVAMDTFYIEPIDQKRMSDTASLLALRESLNLVVEKASTSAA